MVSVSLSVLLAGAISVVPATECPASPAVAAELERLGALAALDQVGTAKISVDQAWLHIEIRDPRGLVLGGREVSAPSDCATRASLAAVLIAAWTGEWIATNLGEPARAAKPTASPPVEPRPQRTSLPAPARPPSEPIPSPAAPTTALPIAEAGPPPAVSPPANPPPAVSPPAVAAGAPSGPIVPGPAAPIAVRRPLQVEIGLLGLGAYDGDAGALGLGGQALLLGDWLSLVALLEDTAQRQRALGPGQASYSSLRFGLGAGVRRAWTHLFVDLALVPELGRSAVHGSDLVTPNTVTAWGIVADGRGRLGWRVGRIAPFIYLGTSWSFLREHLTLEDRTNAAINLSRLNLAAGLGISFLVR